MVKDAKAKDKTILSYPVPLNLNYNYNYGIYSSLFILIISIISFMSPTLMFFFLILGSLLITIFLFPSFFHNIMKEDTIVPLLIFLYKIKFLPYVSNLHFILFYKRSNRSCYYIIFFCNLITIIYAFTTRYYIYHTLVLNTTFNFNYQFSIFIIIFIGIYNLYYKLLINLSIILVSFSRKYQKQLLDIFILTVEPGDLPNVPDTSNIPSQVPSRTYNLFNMNKNSNSHNYFNPLPKLTSWQKGGIIATCVTCTFAAGTLYFTRRSALAAQQSVDLAEVTAGIRTLDSYKEKWPDNTRGSFDSTVTGSPSVYEDYFINIFYPFYIYTDIYSIFVLIFFLIIFLIICLLNIQFYPLYYTLCSLGSKAYISFIRKICSSCKVKYRI